MKSVIRRIARLEDRFAPNLEEEPFLVIVRRMDRKLALDKDACLQILRECGFLRGGSIRVVKLGNIPDGLSAAELEKFLRENGAMIAPGSA
jgi:hypothetical protein